MTLFTTILNSDAFSLAIWLALALCLTAVGAAAIAQFRFRSRLNSYAMAIAENLHGDRTPRLPRLLSEFLGQLRMEAAPEDLLFEICIFLKSRTNRISTSVRLISPALGITGTVYGFITYLGEHSLGSGHPDFHEIAIAAFTTLVGMPIMILSILVGYHAQALADALASKSAEHFKILERTQAFAERDVPVGSSGPPFDH